MALLSLCVGVRVCRQGGAAREEDRRALQRTHQRRAARARQERDVSAHIHALCCILILRLTHPHRTNRPLCANRLEKELAHARQQNDLTAQLSRELANAQRDIRELHRKNSIQSLLKGSNALVATGSGGTRASAAATRMAGQTDYAAPFAREAMPPPSPVSPSSTSSRSSTTSSSSSPANNNSSSQQQQLLIQLVSQPNEYLVRCPDKLLMHVFAFLDANSVFAVSLTNHSLLARVHIMFGMTTSVVTATTATATMGNGSARRGRASVGANAATAQASPKPRLQPKNRSQSSIAPSEKEKAQVRPYFVA